jgi:DNA excision repair protein ERCC-3
LGWKVLEGQGWIAQADCFEVRLPMPDELKMTYAIASKRDKFRIAAENPAKMISIKKLLEKHKGALVLIIGVYIKQLTRIAEELSAPLITGKTTNAKHEEV